jgi:hypothetical protein
MFILRTIVPAMPLFDAHFGGFSLFTQNIEALVRDTKANNHL